MLAELRKEWVQINRAIITLESLMSEHGNARGRVPDWMVDERPSARPVRKRSRSVAKKSKKRK